MDWRWYLFDAYVALSVLAAIAACAFHKPHRSKR